MTTEALRNARKASEETDRIVDQATMHLRDTYPRTMTDVIGVEHFCMIAPRLNHEESEAASTFYKLIRNVARNHFSVNKWKTGENGGGTFQYPVSFVNFLNGPVLDEGSGLTVAHRKRLSIKPVPEVLIPDKVHDVTPVSTAQGSAILSLVLIVGELVENVDEVVTRIQVARLHDYTSYLKESLSVARNT
jgi:hypothetical protein